MAFAVLIDGDGYYVQDVPDADPDDPNPLLIWEPVPGGFIRPKWNGSAWMEGDPAAALASAKTDLKANALRLADAARLLWLPDGVPEFLTIAHFFKIDEARRGKAILDAAGTPTTADFPFADAAAARLETTISAVITDWWNQYWKTTAPYGLLYAAYAIENILESAYVAIDAAASISVARAVVNALDFPEP